MSHDEEDGAWTFHPKSGLTPENEMKVVALKTVYALDSTIASLANLKLGWCAWRDDQHGKWNRSKL